MSGQSMRRTLLNTTLVCALGAALLAAATSARAEDVPADKKFLRSILEGIGLQRDGGPGISYQERGPLVVPANRSLPEPEKPGQAANNPAWPKDPDVERRKEASRALNRGRMTSDVREEEQNPLRPDQLTPGRDPRALRRASTGGGGPDADGGGRRYSPNELGAPGAGVFSNVFGGKEEAARFTGEPPRASLTDPPQGYQTPSAAQPYGIGQATARPTDYYGTHGTPDGAR